MPRCGGTPCRRSWSRRAEKAQLLLAGADSGASTGARAAQQGARDAGAEATQAEAEADVDEIDDAAHVCPQHPHPVARHLLKTLVVNSGASLTVDVDRCSLVSGCVGSQSRPEPDPGQQGLSVSAQACSFLPCPDL